VGAVVIWMLWLRPQALGGRAGYIIVSGRSMAPTMHGGDLAIVRRERSYRVGDVVTYRIPNGEFRGRRIIHRIVGGDGTAGFTLRGDNKPDADRWYPRRSDIEGKLWLRLPSAGRAVALARSPAILAAAVGGFVFALTLTWPARERSPGRGIDRRFGSL
jgi:signal peptidase